MKKIILPVFCALFVLTLSVGVVLAETPKPSTTNLGPVNAAKVSDAQKKELEAAKKKLEREKEAAKKKLEQENETVKKKFEQEREKKIKEIENEREDFKTKLEQEKKGLKDKRFEKVVTRFEKITGERRDALARLDLIAGKIQSRIDKLKASGTDVSAISAALAACGSVKLAAAAATVDSESQVSTIDFNSANAKELAQAQVNAIHTSNQALKSYHSCLSGVISQAPNSSGKGATSSAL